MTPDIIIYHGDAPAADWQPMTDEPETFDQWNTCLLYTSDAADE